MANLDFAGALGARTSHRRASKQAGWRNVPRPQNTAALKGTFGLLAAVTDLAAILAVPAIFAQFWHSTRYMSGVPGPVMQIVVAVAFFMLLPSIAAGEYAIASYLDFRSRLRRLFQLWNLAFLAALALAFLTKTSDQLSRAAVVTLYVAGFASLAVARLSLVAYVRAQGRRHRLVMRRLVLVGCEKLIREFTQLYDMQAHGLEIAAAAILRDDDETLADDLALAAASARMLRPDDIVVLLPWSQKQRIEACIDSFLRIPAAIHLGPERVLDRFERAEITRIGPVSSLLLTRSPMGSFEIVAKRLLDFLLAALALVALAPFLAAVAVAIKIDSRGPVFFSQRRYGFNQEPFRIFKFRSMTTMEDGRVVTQCRANDARLTRVGAFIRRWNIDELPQLVNVLRGEMSLVGPRPHAMTHDQAFHEKIALYARRHNVRPGLTGWAQVNGFRGVTDTDDKMRRRVEYDLYYIDNWSIFFDLRILLLTVLSSKAYRNAR